MTELNPRLLSIAGPDQSNVALHATHKAHGLYHTRQFVLRLSPEIHRSLGAFESGITTSGQAGYEGMQAMSTFLHETIHWWQHIGSTFGFVYGLNYPVQSHVAYQDLLKLTERDGFKKSVLKRIIELGPDAPSNPDTVAGLGNRIINNHFDLMAFRAFSLGPSSAEKVVRDHQFESVGHSFGMTYEHTLNILRSTVDKCSDLLPDPRQLEEGLRDLTARKVQGFYYGSPVQLWPLGALEILEGQARFSQIQYLFHGSGHSLKWEDFRRIGMLRGVYVAAFIEFLRLTESNWPDTVDDPLVALFLLTCDLALNPSAAFPLQAPAPLESFVDKLNVGARFCKLALVISQIPSMKKAIVNLDRCEYETLSSDLCEAILDPPQLQTTKTMSDWFDHSGPLSLLRREYDEYCFGSVNFVVRHLFAHFLAFQEDKYRNPEFFCWPGAWMTGDRVSKNAVHLFERHGALFVDKELDDGVFPRVQQGRNEERVQSVFNDFYYNTVVYDLINQWISEPGPFKYDVSWLTATFSTTEAETFLRHQFKSVFGLDPRDAEIIA